MPARNHARDRGASGLPEQLTQLVNDQLGMRYSAPGNNTNGWQQFGQIAGGVAGGIGGLMTGAGALQGMGGSQPAWGNNDPWRNGTW